MRAAARDPWVWSALLAGPVVWGTLHLLQPVTSPDLAWTAHVPAQAALLVLVYPVLEEIAFRGVLQAGLLRVQGLTDARVGLSAANVLATAAFTITHLAVRGVPAAALVVAPSLLLGALFDRHRSVALCSLVHIWWNLGYFMMRPPNG